MILTDEILEKAKNKILDPLLYATPEGGFPHVYNFENGNKKVVFFAASHSPVSKEEQFNKIKNTFTALVPDMVFVEGISLPTPEIVERFEQNIQNKTWEEVLEKHGEPTFTYKLALEHGVKVISPEYSMREEIPILKQEGFTEELVFLLYGTQSAHEYTYQKRDETLESFVSKKLKNIAQHFENKEYSFEYFAKLVKEYFSNSVDLETGQGFGEKCNPMPPKENSSRKWYITNDIVKVLSRKRDELILANIAQTLETHDRLLIVYGGGHGVMLEPAIEYLVNTI